MPARVWLEVTGGLAEPRVYAREEHDVILFGRAPQCHCSIPGDPFLSKNHFLVEVSPPECVLRDLGSTNGTCVNGAAVGGTEGAVGLKDGDVITAGTLQVVVHVEQAAAAAPRAPGAPAKTWAKFPGLEIVRELGSGTMGKAFLVRLAADGRPAVLKTTLTDSVVEGETKLRYFLREIECTKALKHPNIVAFLDVGRLDDKIYFLLEYCDEGSVSDLLKSQGGRLPLAQAGPLMLQALDGLAFAHGKDIVHRDLKPANILLSGAGGELTAKIADFGLAKDFRLAGLSGVTEAGMSAGTLAYAPREQLVNFRFTEPASDIFSIAATFYSMITGATVYDFEAARDPIDAVLDGRVVPLAQRDPTLPLGVCDALDKALSADPKARQPSAAALRTELATALQR